MSDNQKEGDKSKLASQFIELLKYPTLVFSIVVAIVVLKMVLGLEFGMVTELSTSGLKFAEQSNATTLKAISELESSLNEATIRIESLEKLLADSDGEASLEPGNIDSPPKSTGGLVVGSSGSSSSGSGSSGSGSSGSGNSEAGTSGAGNSGAGTTGVTSGEEPKSNETTTRSNNYLRRQQVTKDAFAASQFVSDTTANIAGLRSELEHKSIKKTGYIWIGNYDGAWEKMTLIWVDSGKVVDSPPDAILAGTSYSVRGNMVIRDGLPPNNKEYYRARANIGVIPRGQRVTVLEQPQMIDREFAKQYWVKVEFSQ